MKFLNAWKHKSETENEDCVIKVYALKLILKNWGKMAEKATCRRRSKHLAIFNTWNILTD